MNYTIEGIVTKPHIETDRCYKHVWINKPYRCVTGRLNYKSIALDPRVESDIDSTA